MNRTFSLKRRSPAPATLALAALAWTSLCAQTPPPPPDEAVQMDAFTVTTATRSAKYIDHIPGAVNLISSDDLTQQHFINEDVTSVLEKTIPGYSPSRESLGMTGETLRGRTPLILFDGVPQSTPLRDAFREGYFADTSIVERIEVLDGPSATEGLGASGGIINFISKSATRQGNHTTLDGGISTQFESNNVGWRGDLTFAHKDSAFDLFFGASTVSRIMHRDAHGTLIGIDTGGTTDDTTSHDLFLKLGRNFGANAAQRVQFTYNRYDIGANNNYVPVDGNRTLHIVSTAKRGVPIGKPMSNYMQEATLEWTDSQVAGGTATVQFYWDKEAMIFAAQNVASFQDPLIAPLGTLYDQSATDASKYGARTIWVRPDLLLHGLELSIGADFLHDTTQQRLILTSYRTFVPPMKYFSKSPFAQLEYENAWLTVRGGARYDSADLTVDSYTGRYAVNRVAVQGGTLSYRKAIPNAGAIVRMPYGLSAYVSYSQGYSVPDVGTILRNVNIPNQTVNGLAQLDPIVATNVEGGANWRQRWASFGVSYYVSKSKYGAQRVLNPVTGVSELARLPVDIKGVEAKAEWKPLKTIVVNALYSHIDGQTAAVSGGPVNLSLSAVNQSPDKIVGVVNWAYVPQGHIRVQATQFEARNINIGRTGFEEHFSGYGTVDASTTYQTPWGTWALGVENLLNKFYVTYISQAAVGQANNAYFAGRGRTYTLSYTISF